MKISENNISYIIPAYNAENTLDRCVNSLIEQTRLPDEILIIIDGATDSTELIAKAWQKKYPSIIKIFSKKNGGVGSARNFGIEKSTCNFISLIDADDAISCDFNEILMNLIETTGADLAVGSAYSVDQSKDNSINPFLMSWKNIKEGLYDIDEFISFVPVWGKIYSKNLIGDSRFLLGVVHEDNHFTALIHSKIKKVAYDKNAKYYYYSSSPKNSNNTTITGNLNIKTFNDFLLISEKINVALKSKNNLRISGIYFHGQIKRLISYYKECKNNKVEYFKNSFFFLIRSFIRHPFIFLNGVVRWILK